MAKKFNESAVAKIFKKIVSNFATSDDLSSAEDKIESQIDKIDSRIDGIISEGGEPNIIDTVQQNGVDLEVTNKTVNVTVPEKVSELENDAGYATGEEISGKVDSDGGELANTIVTYEDEETTVTSFPDFISSFVSGSRVGKWFKDFYAGCQYILHVGSLVNNCVTDNADLPLSAAQGKVLMDELTQVKSDLLQSGYAHNAVYRGQYLGTEVTSEQYAAISNGTFDDLYIGDYWTIDGVNWRIAAINYYYNTGSSYNFNTNHLVIVPDTNLYTAQMNDSNTTEGGYVGSQMYTTNIANARSTIKSAFGSAHVATHEVYLTNAVTNGYPSGGAWSDEDVLLMNEQMVYGCPIRQQMCYGGSSVQNHTIEKSQLPLFFFAARYVNIRSTYWLRDIVTASTFAHVSSSGNATSSGASSDYGVRPAFCLIS